MIPYEVGLSHRKTRARTGISVERRRFAPRRSSNAASRFRTNLPMRLTEDDVRRIARLARIEIDAAETRDVHAKLTAIFGLIDELQAIDTTGIEPMAHAQDVMAPLREDDVSEPDRRDLYQSVAPAVENGLYLVPRVVE
jgi:aspartyl-tRNA(Asn)/glutamyl-tRNA(Gln) amidotransferase subunit C